jgi:hypothetical protein
MKRLVALVLAAAPTAALAGTAVNSANFFISIPTLDEVGLGGLIAVIAGVAGWSLRRRRRK